ncbi:unnamed protein product, partial [Mesorhabditis spiculigera]
MLTNSKGSAPEKEGRLVKDKGRKAEVDFGREEGRCAVAMSQTSTNSEFRQRVNTASSRDSGIDLREMKSRSPTPMQTIPEVKKENGHHHHHRIRTTKVKRQKNPWSKVDADTVLWCIVFVMTVFVFRLPLSVWFSIRTDWTAVNNSLILLAIFWVLGFAVRLHQRHPKSHKLVRQRFALQTVIWLVLALAAGEFCRGTWELFHLWSLYIVGVSFMFVYSIVPVIVELL